MVHHHLDSTTILDTASGNLDEAVAVVVAVHLATCPECRQAVRTAEAVGGDLLETIETAEMSTGALDSLLKKLDAPADPAPAATMKPRRSTGAAGDIPQPLHRYIGVDTLDDIPWQWVAPGVERHALPLSSSTGSSLYMLRIAAGKAVPEHGHGGVELTQVLSGSYTDDLGRFGPGDVADLDEEVEHRPRVDAGEPCICLVATEAPTRFKGLASRLLQPVIGI